MVHRIGAARFIYWCTAMVADGVWMLPIEIVTGISPFGVDAGITTLN